MTTITIERAILDRLIDAWDSTVLPKSRDGMMQERMEDLRAAMAVPATAPSALAGQGAALYGQLVAAIKRLLSAQDEPERFGCVGPSPSEIAHRNLMQLIQHVCIGIDSPPAPAWQDAPTCAGLWVSDYGKFEVEHVNQADVNSFDVAYNAGGRWFGPIPQDIAKEKERTK